MIPENREKDTYKAQCMKELQEYIRQEVNYSSLSNKAIKDSLEKRLYFKAKDWAYKHNTYMQDVDAENIAKEAINNFISNQENKPVDDKRGLSRLGYVS